MTPDTMHRARRSTKCAPALAPLRFSPGRRFGRVILMILATLLIPQATGADLIGNVEAPDTNPDRSDAEVIRANPLLVDLVTVRPDLFETVLEYFRTRPDAQLGRKFDLRQPPDDLADILGDNPDIASLYRESPEAALDLIRLIRDATRPR